MHKEEIKAHYPAITEADSKMLFVATQREKVSEIRHENTTQRVFERGFRSIDVPRADGRMREYAYRKRDVNRLVNSIDARFDDARREMRWQIAMARLSRAPELQRTLQAIRDYREKPIILEKLGISDNVYRFRFFRITKLLKLRYVI